LAIDPVNEGAQHAPPGGGVDQPRGPHGAHARVHREDGVVGGQLVKRGGEVLGVDRSASAHLAGVRSDPRHQLAVPPQHLIQEGPVRLVGDAG